MPVVLDSPCQQPLACIEETGARAATASHEKAPARGGGQAGDRPRMQGLAQTLRL